MRRILIVLIVLFLFTNTARADCTLPAGVVGDQVYNTSFNVMQYCDGTDWTAMRGDDLGDHIATENIQLGAFYLSGDGGNEGVFVNSDGEVGIGMNTPTYMLDVTGDINISSADALRYGGDLLFKRFVSTSGDSTTFTAIGTASEHSSLDLTTSYIQSLFIGRNAGRLVSTGQQNVAVGPSAGYSLNTGGGNSFFGQAAGIRNSSGSSNVFLGTGAGKENRSGNRNIMIGTSAGAGSYGNSNNLSYNVFIGYAAAEGVLTDTTNNVIIGNSTAATLDDGDYNIVIGSGIDVPATGTSNYLSIGDILFGSGVGTTAGSKIGAVQYCDENLANCTAAASLGGGSIAIDDLTDGVKDTTTNNFFLGHEGGGDIGVNNLTNTGVGIGALDSLDDPGAVNSFGDNNTALGYDAGTDITTGRQNTTIGSSAGDHITTGSSNTAIGNGTLNSINSESYNTAVGAAAVKSLTTGNYNTGMGVGAGSFLKTGDSNVFLGFYAARGNGANYSYDGSDNTIIGDSAALNLDNTNDNNVIIGTDTAASLTGGGSGNILLGYGVDVTSATSSNELNIGNILFGSGAGTTAGSKIGAVQYCDENLANCTLAASLGGGAADNLGDHTATQAVDMDSFDIDNGGVFGMQKAYFIPTAALAPTK